MKKYQPCWFNDGTAGLWCAETQEHGYDESTAVYLASDVDARIAELERHLKQMLASFDELERDIGQEIRGVTYYEAKKALGL